MTTSALDDTDIESKYIYNDFSAFDEIEQLNSSLYAEEIYKGLIDCGFIMPREIQSRIIPAILDNYDAIVQSKSGLAKQVHLQ